MHVDVSRERRPARRPRGRRRAPRACRRCRRARAGPSGARARPTPLRSPMPSVLEQPEQQTWIDAPGACRHDEALDRREAHRRVDGATAVHGRERGAGAEVAADHPQLLRGPAEELGRAARGVGVREAVEAEAAERVPLAPLARQGVRRRGVREVAVERRVEAGHGRNVREHGGDGGHRVERGGLVQRRERRELPQCFGDLGVEPHGSGEPRAAVDHAVRDRVGAAQAVERLAELLGVGPPGGGGELGVLARSASSSPRSRSLSELEPALTVRTLMAVGTVSATAATRGRHDPWKPRIRSGANTPMSVVQRSRESRPMLSIPLLRQVTVGEVMHEGVVTCSPSDRHRQGRGS